MLTGFGRLGDSIQKRVERVSTGDEDTRKRLYIAFYILISSPAVAFLGVQDLVNGRIADGAVTLAIFFMFMCIIALIVLMRRVFIVYRVYSVLLAASLGYLLYLGGGSGHAFLWMYLFPISLFYIFGTREGLFWLVVSSLVAIGCMAAGAANLHYDSETISEFILTYTIVSILSFGIESSRTYYYNKLSEEKLALEQSIKQVKTLQGLLPICASCKKIRDDKGYWNQLEVYIRDNSEADFSHSICPECFPKLYPELVDKRQTEISDWG